MEDNNTMMEVEQQKSISITRSPELILAEAKKAAIALHSIIDNKPKKVMMNGEQYLEFEDWQVLGKFYGITAKIVKTEPVEFGEVRGFMARAVAIDNRTGMELSAADAMCLNDEDKWSTRTKYKYVDILDEKGNKIWVKGANGKSRPKSEKVKDGEVPVPAFQLRSMAQTRACAKCLRNILAWVVVMAGYRPQVAEEMTGDEDVQEGSEQQDNTSMPQRKATPEKAQEQSAEPLDRSKMRKLTSKYDNKCGQCGGGIKAGETIYYSLEPKLVLHEVCPFSE